MTNPIWHVGLDAGGTGTELRAEGPGDATCCIEGPGANLQRLGVTGTCDVLVDLLRRFRDEAVEGPAAVCAGISGAGRASDQAAVRDELVRRLDEEAYVAIYVVHDGVIALEGAFGGESGAITITGTGSLVLARARDRSLLRAGGWGHVLGDDGSGFALGRAGLRAVAACYDGGPPTQLTALLEEAHGITDNDELIHHVYAGDWPLQQMAPLVVRAAADGDAVADGLVHEAARGLARQVSWLAGRGASIKEQVAPIGGLVNASYYREVLYEELRRTLPGWDVAPPAHPPAVGAVLLARRKAVAATSG